MGSLGLVAAADADIRLGGLGSTLPGRLASGRS